MTLTDLEEKATHRTVDGTKTLCHCSMTIKCSLMLELVADVRLLNHLLNVALRRLDQYANGNCKQPAWAEATARDIRDELDKIQVKP